MYLNSVETAFIMAFRLQQELVDSSGEPLYYLLDQLVSRLVFCATLPLPSPRNTFAWSNRMFAHPHVLRAARHTGCLTVRLAVASLWLRCVLCALSQCCHTANHLLCAFRFFTTIKYEQHK